jgi:hypothetical protein
MLGSSIERCLGRCNLNLEPEKNTSDAVIQLAHPSDVVPVMTHFATNGLRSVDIFSIDLNPSIYDDPELVAAISTIARRGKQSRLRILVRNPETLYGGNHGLVALARRLPSRVQIRVYTEGAKDRNLGFFCVDEQHLVYFMDESQWQGFARHDARAESAHALNEFEHLWLYGSVDDPNFRTLTI